MNVQQNLQRIPCSGFRNLFAPRCKRCLDFSWRLFPGILQRDDAHQAAGHTALMIQIDLPAASSRGPVQRIDVTISVTQYSVGTTTHLVEILVRHECEPELRRAANNTRWSTLEESLEAFLVIYDFSLMKASL
jgi:hypothetical protein